MYLSMYKDVNSGDQLSTLLHNPIEYLQRLFTTISVFGGDYIYSLLGSELGWNEFAYMYTLFPLLFGLLFIYANTSDESIKVRLTKYQNIIIGLIILAVVGLIFTSLYIQWNEPQNTTIIGVQGRYFIPLIPIATFFIFSKLKFTRDQTEEQVTKKAGIGICIINMYMLINLLILNI